MTELHLDHDPVSEGLWEKYGPHLTPAIIAAVVTIAMTAVSWSLSLTHNGAATDAKLDAVSQRVDRVEGDYVRKGDVEDMRRQMDEIRGDTQYLRQRIDAIYGSPQPRELHSRGQ